MDNQHHQYPIYQHPYPAYPQAYGTGVFPTQPSPHGQAYQHPPQYPPPPGSHPVPPQHPGQQPSAVGQVPPSTPQQPNDAIHGTPATGAASSTSQQVEQQDSDDDQHEGNFSTVLWDRAMRYSDEGVAQLRREWDKDYSNHPMPPPPPGIFANRDEGVASAKNFAKQHGYTLTIAHSNRDKAGVINRILLKCQYGGKQRNMHENTPELRQRQRFSRKTDCPMKMRLQKRRFGDEWVMCISRPNHNHASDKTHAVPSVSQFPDLEAALHEWHLAELAKGDAPHGNTLKSRALALFAEMPQYRGRDPPNLDRKWLDDYRRRYGLPGKTLREPGPPRLVDWNDEEASAAALAEAAARPTQTREVTALNGVDQAFEDPTMIRAVQKAVKAYMARYDASHDWDHILRVVNLAKKILRAEIGQYANQPRYDAKIVYLAALVHDLGDHKYAKPDENVDNQIAELLLTNGAAADVALKVQLIARNVSFSNEVKNPRMMKAVLEQHPELGIVQDADRLDAIGAIGIGRTFCFTGAKKADSSMTETVDHFKEKLERLEGMMKTSTGKRLARERTERLQTFRRWWDEEYKLEE